MGRQPVMLQQGGRMVTPPLAKALREVALVLLRIDRVVRSAPADNLPREVTQVEARRCTPRQCPDDTDWFGKRVLEILLMAVSDVFPAGHRRCAGEQLEGEFVEGLG